MLRCCPVCVEQAAMLLEVEANKHLRTEKLWACDAQGSLKQLHHAWSKAYSHSEEPSTIPSPSSPRSCLHCLTCMHFLDTPLLPSAMRILLLLIPGNARLLLRCMSCCLIRQWPACAQIHVMRDVGLSLAGTLHDKLPMQASVIHDQSCSELPHLALSLGLCGARDQ